MGHETKACPSEAHCAVCQVASLPVSHRIEGKSCKPPKKKGGNKSKRKAKPASPVAQKSKLAVTATPHNTGKDNSPEMIEVDVPPIDGASEIGLGEQREVHNGH